MAVTHARVTNNNDFAIEDRYDGIPIILEPGKSVRIPIACAVLWFDMPVDVEGMVTWRVDANSWANFSRRQGWTNIEPQIMPNGTAESMNHAFQRVTAEAAAKCAKIKVEPVSMVLREVTEEETTLPEPRDTAIEGHNEQPATPAATGRRGR